MLVPCLGCRDQLESGGVFMHEFRINEESYLLLARVREQNAEGFHTLIVSVSRIDKKTNLAESKLSHAPSDKHDEAFVNGKKYFIDSGNALFVFGDRNKLVECPRDKNELVESLREFIQLPK